MKKKDTILDVRTKMECFLGKIEGSVNIPLDQIPNNVEKIREMQPVIVCCAAGVRSAQAVAFLKNNGIENIYDGGGWKELQHKLNNET